MDDSVSEMCSFVSVGEQVQRVRGRLVRLSCRIEERASWKDLLRAKDEILKERCIEFYKEENRDIKRRI